MNDVAQDDLDEIAFAIRNEQPGDREGVRKVHQEAFGGDAEANLVDALREGGFCEVSLVVITGGRVVGHLMFSRVSIVTAEGSVDALSLAPMAIHPDFHGRGIGSRLVASGLARCHQLGYQIVLVLGHPEFYGRFSFSAELARQVDSPFGGGEAWMARELVANAMKNVVGRVEFSPPFAELK